MHLQKIFQPIVALGDPTCALLEQWDVNQNHVSPSLIGCYSKKKHIVEQKTGKYLLYFQKLKFRVNCSFYQTFRN